MPSHISRGRLLAAALAGGLLLAAPASADVRIVQAYAGPVTPGTICTPEPSDAYFGTAGVSYVPGPLGTGPVQQGGNGLPRGQYAHVDEASGDGTNLPDITDITPSVQAGTATDFCAAFRMTPDATPGITGRGTPAPEPDPATDPKNGDDLQSIVIDLPTGVLAAVASAGTCTEVAFRLAPFSADTGQPSLCPASSQVGEAYVRATINGATAPGTNQSVSGAPRHRGDDGSGNNPEGGAAFRLPAGPNELARIGIDVRPAGPFATVKIVTRLVLAPDGSGRVRALASPPRVAYKLGGSQAPDAMPVGSAGTLRDLYVEAFGLKVFGPAAAHPEQVIGDESIARTAPDAFNYVVPAMAADFAETGTDCSTPSAATFRATTFGGSRGATETAPVTSSVTTAPVQLVGCETLPFLPTIAVSTTSRAPARPTGVTVQLGLLQAAGVRRSALLRDAVIELPAGLELGAQVAAGDPGLKLCSAADFDADRPLTPSSCPAAAAVGTVSITSPLVPEPFVGRAFLGEQSGVGALPLLLLEVAQSGASASDAPRIKLVGQVSVNDQGQVTTTFRDSPQLRFSLLRLEFAAGPNALFVTPRACGTTSGTSSLTPWSGQPAKTALATVEIDQDCDLPGFAPSFGIAVANPQAGARSASTITIARPDRSPWLRDIATALPSGFLADLGIPAECSAAEAAAGACPASSRIGTVRAKAGAGERPLTLTGSMFLTERGEGHVAGASIVVRAMIGDLDLGDVIVPASIDLRPTDAGLILRTTAPVRFRGLALNLQEISVDLDREGFGVNPTACGPLDATASLTADGGATAEASASVSYQGCGDRPFAPGFAASLSGDVRPLGHPTVRVSLTPRSGDSNIRATQVTLPAGLAADLGNLQRSCAPEAFEAGACPAANRVGSVVASAAITPEAIPGDVFLVRVPGESLPGLGLAFSGRYAQRVLSVVKVSPQGRILTRFDAIPDLPLTRLELTVDGGAAGPIQVTPAACERSSWDAGFVAHGGQTAIAQQRVECAPGSVKPKAIKGAALKFTRKKGLTLSVDDLGGRTLQAAKLTMPKGLTIDRRAAKRKNVVRAKLYGGSAKSAVSSKSISIAPKQAGGTGFGLAVKPVALRGAPKRGRKLTFRLRIAFKDGVVQTQNLSARAP